MITVGKLPLHYVQSDSGHYGPTVVEHNDLKVIACLKCSYRHLDPLPDPAQVTRHYAQADTFYQDSADWFRKERQEHEQGLWDPMYYWQMSLLEPYAGDWPVLVDLGTGAGWFVRFWRQNYGPAYGVEPSRTARGRSPCPGAIEPDLGWAVRRVGAETPVLLRAALVLEHLPDPVGFLREGLRAFPNCKAVLLVVPNDFNPAQLALNRRLKDNRYWWVAKDHINYFSPNSLRLVMEQAGLKCVYMGVTAPVELAALTGYSYIGNDKRGQRVHCLRLHLEQWPGVIGLYQWAFRKWGAGRELVAIGVPDKE